MLDPIIRLATSPSKLEHDLDPDIHWRFDPSTIDQNVVNTVKLELPSLSQVHPRGSVGSSWYNPSVPQRSSNLNERLPAIQHRTSSSTDSSPRGGSFSSASVLNGTNSSHTSYSASVTSLNNTGLKTPSPDQTPQILSRDGLHAQSPQESPYGTSHPGGQGFQYNESYGSMNTTQPYMDVHAQHISTSQHPSSGPPSHYSQYQPPALQPASQIYPSPQGGYGGYAYGNGLGAQSGAGHPASASMSQTMVPQSLPPVMTAAASGPGGLVAGGDQYGQPRPFDTTGQLAPPGMKPRVTATLWEDEGSLCFQVEAKGVCVARREDNHMINGTKLLNVAGMTRGRRDGILKSEKTRHVVKIGPMHLKGVWIPFDRALDFANKEKITELLYPLFVHDIGALLYHPSNQNRAGGSVSAMAVAAERRRTDPSTSYLPRNPQPPPLTHHHSMSNAIGAHVANAPHSIAPHPSSGRPGIDRAHTFPTPPTSASSMMGLGNQGSSYEWSGPNVSSIAGSQPLSIDTGLSNARSVPVSPANTPPGAGMQNMQQYQIGQSFDSSRPMYSSAPAQQGQYIPQRSMSTTSIGTYGQQMPQSGPYMKGDMAPPSRGGPEGDHTGDAKPDSAYGHGEQVGHGHHEDEADHEHENEYTHSNGAYNPTRGPYSYNPNAPQGGLSSEHAHLSPEMTGSPHQNASGRATPRTAATGQGWGSAGYSTPQRSNTAPTTSSNLYNVMTDNRSQPTNGSNTGGETYGAPYGSSTYSQVGPGGLPPSNKRVRELDDDEHDGYARPANSDAGEADINGLKRRKTIREDTVGGSNGPAGPGPIDSGNGGLNRSRSMIQPHKRR